jgi:hypothetical protein
MRANRSTGLILIASCLFGCSGNEPVTPVRAGSAQDLPLVKGKQFVGVIFPASKPVEIPYLFEKPRGRWTPTEADVVKCEANLRPELESIARALGGSDTPGPQRFDLMAINDVLDHLTVYRRQYVGIVTPEGSKRIVLNCFPGPSVPGGDSLDDWRQQIVRVEDGGSWFWRIQCHITSGHYSDFNSNGDA